MRKFQYTFSLLFAFAMLIFCLFIIGFVIAGNRLDAQIGNVRLDLETSRGRERKQQYEYEEVSRLLPEKQEELDAVLPLAEQYQSEVRSLKDLRKELREEKKRIEALLSAENGEEEANP